MSVSPELIRRRLADFEQSAKNDRAARHAELAVFARTHYVPDLEQRHAQIEAIGPWEAKAFEYLSRGLDPGQLALAFRDQFIANHTGDANKGIQP